MERSKSEPEGSIPRMRESQCPEPVEGLSWIYIIECSNSTLYIGHTSNVKTRLNYHTNGAGARHTRLLAPLKLVYVEGPMALEVAVKRERQLKKWSRAKKLALIRDDKDELKRLSRSRY
jgi:putative endonuclease